MQRNKQGEKDRKKEEGTNKQRAERINGKWKEGRNKKETMKKKARKKRRKKLLDWIESGSVRLSCIGLRSTDLKRIRSECNRGLEIIVYVCIHLSVLGYLMTLFQMKNHKR
jgi:hypothetical protein